MTQDKDGSGMGPDIRSQTEIEKAGLGISGKLSRIHSPDDQMPSLKLK